MRDLAQPSTPEIKKGEQVSFTIGFDRDRLAKLDPSALVDQDTWGREEKISRTKAVIEVYQQLPEKMHFKPGVTAVFGENGQGKTLLADVIVMAVRMEQFRQEHGIPKGADIDILGAESDEATFYPILPGHLRSSAYSSQQEEEEHSMFVARIAECVDVGELVLHDPTQEVGGAMRTPAALGNVAMGMSSRQAIDMLESMSKDRHRQSSLSIRIYDEPELGMSPRRHRDELLPMLEDRVSDGCVELVPSNSIVLYESSLPRIDLETPELGIFTPEPVATS